MGDYYGIVDSSTSSDITSMAAMASMASAYSFVFLAIYVLIIIAQWKIFTKAGEKGWKSLIPIYNMVVLYKIVGLSPWLLLLYLLLWVPFVGSVVAVILAIVQNIKLGKAFGQSSAFIVGLVLVNPIFEMILAFGSSQYVGANQDTSSTSM